MSESQFCPECHNFLFIEDDGGKLQFVCHECGTKEEPEHGKAILVYESRKKEIAGYFTADAALADSGDDPVNPRLHIKCSNPKCDSKLVTYQRHQETLKRLFVCVKCKTIWIEERKAME